MKCWTFSSAGLAVAVIALLTAPATVYGGTGSGTFIRADSNADGTIDIGDAIFTLSFLFSGGIAPSCPDAADANDDGAIDIGDAIFTLSYLFTPGSQTPPPPFPTAGTDPTGDTLICGAPCTTPWYADADLDNFGDTDNFIIACVPTGVYTAELPGDCDDRNSDVYPGAPEVCNGIDDDCDIAIDEDAIDGITYYPDLDMDTYGDITSDGVISCVVPPGMVTDHTDCDDSNSLVNPGAIEVCGGPDLNCIPGDELTAPCTLPNATAVCVAGVCLIVTCDAGYVDLNGLPADGCEYFCTATGPEICDDMIDNDCDGLIDTADPDCPFGVEGSVVITELMINPAAVPDSVGEYMELFNTTAAPIDINGWTIRDSGTDIHVIAASVVIPPAGFVVLGIEDDFALNGGVVVNYQYGPTGFFLAQAGDTVILEVAGVTIDSFVYPGSAAPLGASLQLDPTFTDAVLNDSIFNWCPTPAGSILIGGDLGTPGAANQICICTTHWYADVDGDTYGNPADFIVQCAPDATHTVANGLDCDDTDFDVNPGALEDCSDGIDNDCDGDTDAADAECSAGTHLVINEVDYDNVGTDNAEFIEIFNPTASAVSLTNLRLALVNGSTSLSYLVLDLSTAGASIAAGQYLLVRAGTVVVPGGALSITFSAANDNVQNGAPDGIALLDIATNTLIDALSYEGSMTAVTITGFTGTFNLVEGTVLPIAVADSNTVVGSLARVPNGVDSDNAATDWVFVTTLTPGTSN
ncbi:MAG: lamin tail domain-containing protein [Planctomycetota bacterium]